MVLKINLSRCGTEDDDVSIMAQTLGSRNTTLQKLDLCNNPIGNEGASLISRSLGDNALPNVTHLSLSEYGIFDDKSIALMSALKQNTSLLYLELRDNHRVSERAFLASAERLPETKVLQRVGLSWCRGLASAIPLLLVGLRKNTTLFRFHVTDCTPSLIPPTTEDTARYAGGWMQEMEGLGCRNRFPTFRRTQEATHQPRALFRVARFPDVIFQVLVSKPSLVTSEGMEGKEAAKDTGKRKRSNE
jgi:hypothetical protein